LFNNKISKIVNQRDKYYVNDEKMTSSLKTALQYLIRIESAFNRVVFRNNLNSSSNNSPSLNIIPETTRDIYLTERDLTKCKEGGGNNSEMSMSMGTDAMNVETYRSAQLSDTIKELNIGNLIPLKCGHNGLLSQTEIELYSLYLLNSKFIT
jgi:hypothetical protein